MRGCLRRGLLLRPAQMVWDYLLDVLWQPRLPPYMAMCYLFPLATGGGQTRLHRFPYHNCHVFYAANSIIVVFIRPAESIMLVLIRLPTALLQYGWETKRIIIVCARQPTTSIQYKCGRKKVLLKY